MKKLFIAFAVVTMFTACSSNETSTSTETNDSTLIVTDTLSVQMDSVTVDSAVTDTISSK